ncbi:hypothetical protein DW029_02880 [Collinsella sp. AF38-3AC]|nr:hypothetical protein DW029_02880 [Collinsella sp. AF38-3AC]
MKKKKKKKNKKKDKKNEEKQGDMRMRKGSQGLLPLLKFAYVESNYATACLLVSQRDFRLVPSAMIRM